jgi:perosamine synthetase
MTRPLADASSLANPEPAALAGLRLRHVAPAGSPIHLSDLARWAGGLLTGGDATAALQAAVCARFGVQRCIPISTGRAGLTVLLQALARLAPPERNEVLLPAYTCFSVPASVVKAGLRPRLVDIDPATLDLSAAALEQVDGRRALAIVATNLYGLPNDLPTLAAAATGMGAFLIDDAAQAMGASVGDRPSGTWGDAGLYSLDKGKNISAIDGGLLVTSSDAVALELERGTATLGRPGAAALAKDAAKVVAYAAMLPPSVYWIPKSMPGLGLGLTAFTTDFPLDILPPMLARLALTMLPRLDDYTDWRIARAQTLIAALSTVGGVRVPVPIRGSRPVYLRLPVLVDAPARQAPLIAALNRHGIGATGSYPTSLADVAALHPHLANPDAAVPGARHVAARIVTLPTHPYVAARDVERIIDVVRREAAPEAAGTAARASR